MIYSTTMGSEHEHDPLVSRRGEEPDEVDRAGVDEAGVNEPGISEPRVDEAGTEPVPTGSAGAPAGEPLTPEPEPSSREPAVGSRAGRRGRTQSPNMLPARSQRGLFERTFVRIVATCGIVGISVAIAAIMASSNSKGWLIGLVVSVLSVVLAAVLWSSRVL